MAVVLAPAGAIAQAWRDGARQARLVRVLAHCDEVPLDGEGARAAGSLCGRTCTADIVDASVALTAVGATRYGEGVSVLTSDPADIQPLVERLGAKVRLVQI